MPPSTSVTDYADEDYFSEEFATFGDRVAGAREAIGLNQTQLADRLGIKKDTLKKWEEDRAEPRANKLHTLAGVLNVSMIWLINGTGEGFNKGVEEDFDTNDLLAEIRAIRLENARLAERMGRLEKRLRNKY